MTTATTSSLLAQSGHSNDEAHADFYAKLLQLQQDVLAGRHPHYKLSTPTLAQNGLSRQHTSGQTQEPLSKASVNGVAHTQDAQLAYPRSPALRAPNLVVSHKIDISSLPKQRQVPVIEGVLPLTKPDHLVKAENNLKRLRIERELRSAAESSKTRLGEKDTGPWFGANTFDCAQLLQAATSLVKPVSGFEQVTANQSRPESSTPHTESYYSSKVDFSEENIDKEQPEDGEIDMPSATASNVHSAQEKAQQRQRMSGLGPQTPPQTNTILAIEAVVQDLVTPPREDSYSPPSPDVLPYVPNPRPLYEPQPIPSQVPRHQAHMFKFQHGQPPPQTARSRESESYSPPPVDEGHPNLARSNQAMQARTNGASVPQRNGHVHTNGPPAKVRKLRAKKQDNSTASGPDKRGGKNKKTDGKKSGPSLAKPTASTSQPATTVNAAPLGQTTGHNPRKRPRESDIDESIRHVSGRLAELHEEPEQTIWRPLSPRPVSTQPYIKQEPVSPRLPAAQNRVEPPRRLVLREDGTADIQVEAARRRPIMHDLNNTMSMGTPHHGVSNSTHHLRREPVYIEDDIHPSPTFRETRRVRNDTDLRRVASLQHARMVPSPITHGTSPREMHYVESPRSLMRQAPSRYEYVDDGYESSPTVRPRHGSPLMLAEDLSPRTMMAPPPQAKRRIVVDEFGNEYIAMPVRSSPRQSIGSEYIDDSQYTPRRRVASAMPVQQSVYEQRPRTRAAPQVIDLVESDTEAMPPPRLMPQKRRVQPAYEYEAYDSQPQQPALYASRPTSRAVSTQPIYGHGEEHQQYRYVPANVGPRPQYETVARERPYSARPEYVQDPSISVNGHWSGRINQRAPLGLRRM